MLHHQLLLEQVFAQPALRPRLCGPPPLARPHRLSTQTSVGRQGASPFQLASG